MHQFPNPVVLKIVYNHVITDWSKCFSARNPQTHKSWSPIIGPVNLNQLKLSALTCVVSGAILSPDATPLWKLGHTFMSDGVSMWLRSTTVFLVPESKLLFYFYMYMHFYTSIYTSLSDFYLLLFTKYAMATNSLSLGKTIKELKNTWGKYIYIYVYTYKPRKYSSSLALITIG